MRGRYTPQTDGSFSVLGPLRGGCAARLESSRDVISSIQHQRPGDLGDALGMCPAIRPRQAGPCSRIQSNNCARESDIPHQHGTPHSGWSVSAIPSVVSAIFRPSARPGRCGAAGAPRPSHAGGSRGAGGRAARQEPEAWQIRARERAFQCPDWSPGPVWRAVGARAPSPKQVG
jgi:hypothetical protein